VAMDWNVKVVFRSIHSSLFKEMIPTVNPSKKILSKKIVILTS